MNLAIAQIKGALYRVFPNGGGGDGGSPPTQESTHQLSPPTHQVRMAKIIPLQVLTTW